jgi:hypothetical protein
MLALPVPILPVSSVHLHGPAVIPPAVIPNDDQFPSRAGFARIRLQAKRRKFPFVTILDGAASPAQALVTGFRIDSDLNVPLIQVFRESRFRRCNPRTFGSFATKAQGHAATK